MNIAGFLKKYRFFRRDWGTAVKFANRTPKKTIHFDGKMMYYNGNERDRPP